MTEEVNPYKWARENLSPSRAKAFENAYRELERNKNSKEYAQEWRKEEEIKTAHYRAVWDKTEAITIQADTEARALEEQARALFKKAQDLRASAHEEAIKIQAEVYQTEEYKAQRAKVAEIFRKDSEAIKPAIQALMAKYAKAQEEADKKGQKVSA